jgi:hypothetical protein
LINNGGLLIYISAPFSKGDQLQNVRTACLAGDKLIEMGHHPYVPHCTCIWHAISPKTLNQWLQIDSVILARCDAVLRLEGESVGGDIEVGLARRLRIPVYFNINEIPHKDKALNFA